MEAVSLVVILAIIIGLYFKYNPMQHSDKFMMRRFINWFPLGMTYAFLYMARYNLSVTKVALGSAMSKESFGLIFMAGTITYGFSFLLNGPLVDKIGGKKGIIIAALGSSICNVAMGMVTFLFLKGRLNVNLTLIFSVLYSMNMFFQSYGAVSIIKVKAYWFHVRERGMFGGIFGALLSFGIYFALDWGQSIAEASHLATTQPNRLQRIFQYLFAIDAGTVDATWLVFFIPAGILVFWALLDMFLIQDTPAQAGHEDFDTHDASSGEMERNFSKRELLVKIFTNPIIMMIAAVEFTTGVVRNGVLNWYFIFAHEVAQPGAEYFKLHWGYLLCVTGIVSGFAVGFMSDHYFQSRRGPPVVIVGCATLAAATVMTAVLYTSPITVGICAVVICFMSIAVHSLMSGTAAADFGGRKATATASGITDGFVYLGTGLQSGCLGYLTTKSWTYWPAFLIPFIILGIIIALRMWKSLPDATRAYLERMKSANQNPPG